MLRQLARLTRPVRGVPGAAAIAVYADASDALIPATDRGHEGVACVDDTARALVLLCDLWSATRLPYVRRWATGLLEFVLHMQNGDGRFHNFITDWSGTRNENGETSVAGGRFWQARGVRGLVSASLVLNDPRSTVAARRGVAHVRQEAVAANVRAIHILTAVDLLRAGRMPELRADLSSWADELVGCRREGILFDDPDESVPHLWAHVQEGALAVAGDELGRRDLVDVACQSADRYLAPLIEAGFDLPTVQPDGVASALFGVERLALVTGEERFLRLSRHARAWFDGRNPAGRAVYDRATGRVADGVDAGALNGHSGGESNIAAAQALFPEIVRGAVAHRAAIERALPPALERVARAG